MPKQQTKCERVGLCRLPSGHSGICVYEACPSEPPASIGSGEALIGDRDGEVVIDFGKTGPWQWVRLSPAQADFLAACLMDRAARLRQLADARPH